MNGLSISSPFPSKTCCDRAACRRRPPCLLHPFPQIRYPAGIMLKDILRRVFLFWVRHPWLVFWGTFSGFFVYGVLTRAVMNRAFLEVEVILFCVLAISFILGLRASWNNSPIKAVGILAIWGIVPMLGSSVGNITSAVVIAFLLPWVLIPALLAAATEYAARLIRRRRTSPQPMSSQ